MYGTTTQKSGALEQFFADVRRRTEELCEPLEIEDYIPQPIVDVSPAKWNIAHTTWFFEEMILKKFAAGYREFNPRFGYLFNSYYNSVGERTQRDNRGENAQGHCKSLEQVDFLSINASSIDRD